jgi:hypothetical protein
MTSEGSTLSHARTTVRLLVLAAIGFYAGTAHLSRGHEADFGKQWLAARLVATGHGRNLFDLETQRAELERNYAADVIDRGIWREGIGGPTYPPPLAILLSPLGFLSPRWAAWLVVQLSVVSVVVAAHCAQRLTGGRLWWEVAALAVLSMPSFFLAVGVGQNSAFSLLILVAGLTCLSQGRDFAAGVAWGLFAYKPTWGLAVAWLPCVLWRPRAYLGMFLSGCGLVLLSLPICGISAWFDWVHVAGQTELFYQSIPRWTALSRDLPGLIRRLVHGRSVELIGWVMVSSVVLTTAWTWWRTRGKSSIGLGPAAVVLSTGIILSCPRFMFYDVTLAAIPIWIALGDWNAMGHRARLILGALIGMLWLGTAYEYGRWSMLGPPLDTFALIGLWIWALRASHTGWNGSVASSDPAGARQVDRPAQPPQFGNPSLEPVSASSHSLL